MTHILIDRAIRIAICVTIPFASPAFAEGAGSATPATQTGTGGGGIIPPPTPPVKLGGPGDINPNETGRSFGGPQYSAIAGQFREVWSVTQDGQTVYREGLLDSQGRVRVFKYDRYNAEFISRGYIQPDPSHPDGSRAVFPERWRSTYQNLLAEVYRSSQPQPMQELLAPAVPKGPTGNLLDGHRVIVPGGSQIVYFQGQLDAMGREMVFRPLVLGGAVDAQRYLVGALKPDGSVEWKSDWMSRDDLLRRLQDPNANKGRTGWGEVQRQIYAERVLQFREYTYQDWFARMNARTELQYRLVSPHSRYAEIAAPKDPLPPSRSLVVVPGQGPITPARPAGFSGMNVPGIEYFPEMDPQFRPSRLQRGWNMTQAELQRWRTELRKLVRGQPNAIMGDGTRPGSQTMQRIKDGGIQMGRGVAGFYIAMGMLAGIQLTLNYPNNPQAWDAYISSMTDPASIAQLAGFMAVAGGTYWAGKTIANKAFGPGGHQKFGVQGTLFMGTILMGAFAGTIITEIMADPNSAKCGGFVTQRLIGQFNRDWAACDALWDKWTSNDHWNNMAVNQLLPMFANIMVAGGMFKAVMMGTSWLMNRQLIAVALRSVRFGMSPKGGIWVTLAGLAVQGVLFLGAYWIADQWFQIGQWVQELMTAEWSFSNDPAGHSIRDNKNKLLSEWKRLKASGFADPGLIPHEHLCFDPGRSFGMFYDCRDPNRLGPEALINKYAAFQQSWRRIQMADVENSYKQWLGKSENYYAMLGVAYDFYKGAVERIAFEKNAPNAQAAAAGGFNERYIQTFIENQEAMGQESWKFARDKTYNGWWKYVDTTKLTDYLLTAMACGPEAEGYGGQPDGFFNGLGDWWTGNTSPSVMIDNPTGWKMRFFSPRVVRPIDSERTTACEMGGNRNLLAEVVGTHQMLPATVPLVSPRGSYTGAYEYIKAEIRESILDGGNNKFQNWWETNVTPGTVAVEKELRTDYERLLKSSYLPVLTSQGYRNGWCGPSVTIENGRPVELNAGFEYVLRQLGKPGEACPAEATHRLAYGVLNSLRDEMRLYMSMLIDLHLSKLGELGTRPLTAPAEAERIAVAKAKEMLDVFEGVLNSMSELDPSKRVNIEDAIAKFTGLSVQSKLDHLLRPVQATAAVGQPQPRTVEGLNQALQAPVAIPLDPPPPANPHLEQWAYLLGLKIDGVFIEAALLYRILTTFETQ